MEHIIHYRIFYWVPNTLTGERIAIGLCLFDKELRRLDAHWLKQRDLSRLQKIFVHTSKDDSKNVLNLLQGNNDSWKSKAFDPSFWNYIERYWNGILQISDSKKVYYDGSQSGFKFKSENLKHNFLPLASDKKLDERKRARGIKKKFVELAKSKNITDKVSIGESIPESGRYHLLKPLYLDFGAFNGNMIGSVGLNFGLNPDSLINNIQMYLAGFQRIRKVERDGNFSFVIHIQQESFQPDSIETEKLFKDFKIHCDDFGISVIDIKNLDNFVDEIASNPDLRPLHEVVA